MARSEEFRPRAECPHCKGARVEAAGSAALADCPLCGGRGTVTRADARLHHAAARQRRTGA